jgi:hypothetical protein
MTTSQPLKWLFRAIFSDGTILNQPEDDRSQNHVEGAEHNPSAFSDVLAREDELVAFSLYNPDTDETIAVDLRNGLFTVNGVTIAIHDQYFVPEEHKLRLIYFRESRIDFQGDVQNRYVNRYFIGWQCTDSSGRNKQTTLAVS